MRVPFLLGSVLGLGLLSSLACATGKCPDGTSGTNCTVDTGTPSADTDTDTDSDTDADSDTDTDTDTDSDTDADTGIAQFYFVGELAAHGTTFTSGSFGYEFVSVGTGETLCTLEGDLTNEGRAPTGCPDCDWSFDLSGVTDSVATGSHCDDFGATDGSLDTYFDYSWGFASTYYYDYNGTSLPLEDTIFLYIDSWFSFAFNYGGRDWVSGSSSDATFERPSFDSSGNYVYYYYYQ